MRRILILPAYNEEAHIHHVVTMCRDYVDEVIVVDDSSTDDTFRFANLAGAITLRHKANIGKSGALKTGCDAAIRLGGDVIALLDSDGQHDPADLPRFFTALQDEELDVVVGSRLQNVKDPFIRRHGNIFVSILLKILFRVKIKDVLTGFRVFRTTAYRHLRWVSGNYQADTEMIVRMTVSKLRYKELPIDSIYHDPYKGMTPIDGLLLLLKLVKWRIWL